MEPDGLATVTDGQVMDLDGLVTVDGEVTDTVDGEVTELDGEVTDTGGGGR
jgi:hypothetical protein